MSSQDSLTAQNHASQARFNMVEQQVRTWDVLDFRVLDLLHMLPREAFVRVGHEQLAYADLELPVLAGSSAKMFKPVMDGRLLQSLALTGEEEILEIGTGSGYTTACLAKLGRFVTTVEHSEAVHTQALQRFAAQNFYNIKALLGDGLKMSYGHAFDVVVFGGAVADIPSVLWTWLKPGGRAFVVRGESPAMEALHVAGTEKSPEIRSEFETDIPYLLGCAPKPRAFQI